jgi:hypothetical protein
MRCGEMPDLGKIRWGDYRPLQSMSSIGNNYFIYLFDAFQTVRLIQI